MGISIAFSLDSVYIITVIQPLLTTLSPDCLIIIPQIIVNL